MNRKVAIGAVQFGLDYGVANVSGQTAFCEVCEILNFATQNQVDTLDTAIAYGESEAILGKVGVGDWNIITKLPSVPDTCVDVSEWVLEQFCNSLLRLKQDKVYGLLLHRPSQLLEDYGDELYGSLRKLKEHGSIEKLGVSIYSPDDLTPVIEKYDIDLVQAPINLFDRSMESTGIGKQLQEKGIEVHARSIFLQGLLLMKPGSRPQKFSKWNLAFEAFDKWCAINKKTPLEAALKYVDQLSFVDKLIVGVDSKVHLEQILAALNSSGVDMPVFFDHEDTRLINPSRWSEL